MKKPKSHAGYPFFGYSVVLFIFILLCFVSFSTLSLTTAQSDYEITEEYAKRTESYYECCNKAELWISDIDSILWRAYRQPDGAENFLETASFLLTDEEESYIIKRDSIFLQHTFSNGDTQELVVQLRVKAPEAAGTPLYEIHSWKLQNKT